MSGGKDIEELKEQVASLEEKIDIILSNKRSPSYTFSRFATDFLTGFLVVSAVIFWITFVFVLVYRFA